MHECLLSLSLSLSTTTYTHTHPHTSVYTFPSIVDDFPPVFFFRRSRAWTRFNKNRRSRRLHKKGLNRNDARRNVVTRSRERERKNARQFSFCAFAAAPPDPRLSVGFCELLSICWWRFYWNFLGGLDRYWPFVRSGSDLIYLYRDRNECENCDFFLDKQNSWWSIRVWLIIDFIYSKLIYCELKIFLTQEFSWSILT